MLWLEDCNNSLWILEKMIKSLFFPCFLWILERVLLLILGTPPCLSPFGLFFIYFELRISARYRSAVLDIPCPKWIKNISKIISNNFTSSFDSILRYSVVRVLPAPPLHSTRSPLRASSKIKILCKYYRFLNILFRLKS